MPPKGPYTLCTVNTAPERAKRLVGRLVEDVKDTYIIRHVENAESMFFLFVELVFFGWMENFMVGRGDKSGMDGMRGIN
jgi:hypothetical protein